MDKFNTLYYAVKHKDEDIVTHSRSGGAFTAISDYILNIEGIVYGCCLDEELNIIHSKAVDKKQRDSLRGSKYVQSNLKDTLSEAGNDLKNGKYVLFSGTACQVDGLYSYLQKKKIAHDRLLTVDIVCHGVPSPKVWKDNLRYIESKNKGRVENVNFRNKEEYGWHEHIETYRVGGKSYDSTVFTQLFYSNNITSKSCYICPYKSLNRVSDITLADCWGIEKTDSNFNDDKGTSLVMVNSSGGESVWKKISKNIIFNEIDINDYMQIPFEKPYPMPKTREMFWKDYEGMSFEKLIEKYVKPNIFRRNFFRAYKKLKREKNEVFANDTCCGCTACYSVCPVNCISMEQDEEGFYVPEINEEICIHCNQCVEVCRFKELAHNNSFQVIEERKRKK